MLSTLDGTFVSPSEQPARASRRLIALGLLVLGLAALLGAAGLVRATQSGDVDGDSETLTPELGGKLPALSRSVPETTPCYQTAHVRRATVLLRRPGGRRRLVLTPKTEWGSPRILGVIKQRPRWLGVQAADLENGEIAWMRRSRARLLCSRWSLHVDLSQRRILVRKDGKRVRKLGVGVGRPGNPTPAGRFTVTDKLSVSDLSSPYGCCVLALSGHQTNLPYGWPGGDRLAVHATSDTSDIGQQVSSGCMRANPQQARWLIRTIPLGAPIFIRA
jgi:hypothetical protein